MPTIKDIIEELRFLSDRISTQIRTVAVSLIVVTWGILIGGAHTAFVVDAQLGKKLLTVGILAIFAMFCDFLQYFLGYLNANFLRKKLEKEGKKQIDYEYSSWSYRFRVFFFWFKQVILVSAIIYFLVTIIPYLLPATK
jgi:hypothetical protein